MKTLTRSINWLVKETLIRAHQIKDQTGRTMWCASFNWLILDADRVEDLFWLTFYFSTYGSVLCSGCVLRVQTWHYIALSWRCVNSESEGNYRAKQRAAGVALITILLHYEGNESIEEFIHTSVWKVGPPLPEISVLEAARMYCLASSEETH